jgi:hypothetical protein
VPFQDKVVYFLFLLSEIQWIFNRISGKYSSSVLCNIHAYYLLEICKKCIVNKLQHHWRMNNIKTAIIIMSVHRRTAISSNHYCNIQGVFKKRQNFCYKDLFYYILSTVPFKVVPSTGDTPLPTFLPLLECFLERTFCEGVQFSYHIFPNLRVFKKRPNLLNSAPTSTEGALRLLSAPSGRFWQKNCHLQLFVR